MKGSKRTADALSAFPNPAQTPNRNTLADIPIPTHPKKQKAKSKKQKAKSKKQKAKSKKPITMDRLEAYWAIWSGKRGSNSRPIPWQGIALPTEQFPHMSQRKTHHADGLFNLVAWGGIEPPTQGFSIHTF